MGDGEPMESMESGTKGLGHTIWLSFFSESVTFDGTVMSRGDAFWRNLRCNWQFRAPSTFYVGFSSATAKVISTQQQA